MQQALQQVFASYLLNAAWQIPVVALCAFVASRSAGLSAKARSGLWLTALAAAVVLPAVSLESLLPHATPTVAVGSPSATLAAAAAAVAQPNAPDPLAFFLAPIGLPSWLAWAATALVMAWAAACATRLLAAGRAAGRLVRRSQSAALPLPTLKALEDLAHIHGHRVPPVRRSADVAGPAVVGALRPVILIPERLAADEDELRAALLHEMAHVVRRDYAVNLACELFALPVSWHPALHGIKAGVRRSRELACDAMAAQAMASQKAYARCLVSLAQSLGAHEQAPAPAPMRAALAVGLFGRSDLEDRLMHLMKPREAEGPVVRSARAWGLAALGAGLLGSAALLHVTPVFAQAEVPPAAAAAAAQAEHDAAKPDPALPANAVATSRKGIVITSRHASHRHTWTAADGRSMTVLSEDPGDLSPEQQRQLEATVRDAEAKAAEAEARVNSPEFKARIAAAEAKAAAAERMVDSPAFKARIAQAQARAAAVERMVDSLEFKAKIARAEAAARRAEREVRDIDIDVEPDEAP